MIIPQIVVVTDQIKNRYGTFDFLDWHVALIVGQICHQPIDKLLRECALCVETHKAHFRIVPLLSPNTGFPCAGHSDAEDTRPHHNTAAHNIISSRLPTARRRG